PYFSLVCLLRQNILLLILFRKRIMKKQACRNKCCKVKADLFNFSYQIYTRLLADKKEEL
ncbi:MAG: hypothetical protein ACP5K9_03720, partial [Candidatus Micrarchaeia archaeon]